MTDSIDRSPGEALLEWFQKNNRAVSIVAGVAAVVAVSGWFYMRSAEIKRENAERGLSQAKQSMSAGNTALATTDLQRVASRYVGTPGGVQAAMLLAQMNYDQAKHVDGLKALEPYQSASAAGAELGDVWSLVGDGQIAIGKGDDAVASYRKAVDATEFPGAKAVAKAKLARALMATGKDMEARALWEKLASDPDAAVVKSEAQIRLGELATKPAGKS
ncbi:MAG TPA: tetratricopeptide repeat protein [Gemmatimonadaceae bacterium]